jgi:hypothetical protein
VIRLKTIKWQIFPKNKKILKIQKEVVDVFVNSFSSINSSIHSLKSDEVLSIIRQKLLELGFIVESGKMKNQKIRVPVLYGENGVAEKYFEADAFNSENGIVIEVEAGRAYLNNQFLKDIFQACVMDNVRSLILAVRIDYKGNPDYDKIKTFLDTLYISGRFNLDLDSILLIGY